MARVWLRLRRSGNISRHGEESGSLQFLSNTRAGILFMVSLACAGGTVSPTPQDIQISSTGRGDPKHMYIIFARLRHYSVLTRFICTLLLLRGAATTQSTNHHLRSCHRVLSRSNRAEASLVWSIDRLVTSPKAIPSSQQGTCIRTAATKAMVHAT